MTVLAGTKYWRENAWIPGSVKCFCGKLHGNRGCKKLEKVREPALPQLVTQMALWNRE